MGHKGDAMSVDRPEQLTKRHPYNVRLGVGPRPWSNSFAEYTEAAVGIKQRQAYNYIQVVESLPARLIEENAAAGVTKLALLAKLNPEEREDLTGEALANITVPYMVIRTIEKDTWDDLGRVCVKTIMWTIALFTANKDVALECKIRKALAGLGTIEIERFPDGEPYSIHFTFTTKGA